MTTTLSTRVLLTIGFALGLSACHSTGALPPDTVRLEPGERDELDRYMPFEDGVVYAYRTESTSGDAGVMTVQVGHTHGGQVELTFGGRRETVELDGRGIRFLEGGYLLKAPLVPDSVWEGRFGVVRLVARNVEVTVPAGHFSGCVRTEERDRATHAVRLTRSVYCPHVGLVLLDMTANGSHETALLEHFGPRADPLASAGAVLAER